MNHFLLFAYLFGAVMTGTIAAGYYLVLRPAEEEEQPHLFAADSEQSVTQAFASDAADHRSCSPLELSSRSRDCESS